MYINTSRTERAISLPFVIVSQRYSLVLQARLIENERFYHLLERKVADSFVHSLARSLIRSSVRILVWQDSFESAFWIDWETSIERKTPRSLSLDYPSDTYANQNTVWQINAWLSLHDGSPKAARNLPRCFPLRTRTRGANWDLCARERNSVLFSCMFIKQIYWDVIKHSI